MPVKTDRSALLEGVVAVKRRAPGVRDDPRAKAAGGVDRARWLGVFNLRIEDHGCTRADALEPEMANEQIRAATCWACRFRG